MKRFAIAVLALVVIGITAMPAFAQVNTLYPERVGTLYASAAQDRHVDYLQSITKNLPFNFYLVADIDFTDIGQAGQNLSNGMSAWEAQVAVPATLFVLSNTIAPATSVNVGSAANNVFNYIVGTGSTVAVGAPRVLVTFQALATADFSGVAAVGPVNTPSFPGEVVWVESASLNGCTINGSPDLCIFRFANTGNVRLSTGVADEAETFGGMKARF